MLKQNPFSLYDFLGYFTPGAVFLYCVLLALGHSKSGSFSLSYVQIEKAEIFVPFILAAYLAGHFLSFLSSITIERFSIWAHGYPSKYLLGISHNSYLFGAEPRSARRRIRIFVAIILAPISILDWFLGKVLGLRDLYAKKLDPLLIAVLGKRIEALIDNHAGIKNRQTYGLPSELDFFRYVYHFALENAPSHITKMQNYVALYGFLRTIAFIVLIVFWVVMWHAVTGYFTVWAAFWMVVGFGVLAYMMFMAFVKFYRRFSLEALMAMAVTYSQEHRVRAPKVRTKDAPPPTT